MKSDTIEAHLDKGFDKNKTQYFFSLLGPRFDVMNKLMAFSLRKRFGGKFEAIRILSARPNKQYAFGNYVVINNHAKLVEEELRDQIIYQQEYEDLNTEFLNSPFIKNVSKRLLKKQSKVFVYPFTTSFMKLPKGLVVIGPRPELVTYYDDKTKHYELFGDLKLPRNEVRIFNSKDDLAKNYKKFLPSYITAAYTSGGNEARLVYDRLMLNKFFGGLRDVNVEEGRFLAARIFEKITWAPNVNAIVTGMEETKVLVVTDQILSGNRYLGNIYPTSIPKKVHNQVLNITVKVGNYLSKKGYRGLFGLDFLVNSEGKLVVVDLNPRRQGGYACNALALKVSGVELTDLELACALGENVSQIPAYKDISYPQAWAHTKIKPHDAGQRIKKEVGQGSIAMEQVFKKGGTFKATFFRKGSLFVDGYIGSAVAVGEDRGQIVRELMRTANITLEESLI